jgi:predicted nucleic acid-binding protein
MGGRKISDAVALLREMTRLPGYRYLPIRESWLSLIEPFTLRLQGHRQVTDAYLLGLAIRHKAVLVTLDQSIQAMAGREFQSSLLTLRSRP